MDESTDRLLLDAYRDELYKTRHIRFIRRHLFGFFIERADTPFCEWDILDLWNYNYYVLQVQQTTLRCVITVKRFGDKHYIGED